MRFMRHASAEMSGAKEKMGQKCFYAGKSGAEPSKPKTVSRHCIHSMAAVQRFIKKARVF
jgi:hypothetical protein